MATAAPGGATLAAFVLLVAGCALPAFVDARMGVDPPQVVAVPPVTNETVYPLGAVSFGGMLQRSVLGVQLYDVPELLAAAIDENLRSKNYDTMVLETSPIPEIREAIGAGRAHDQVTYDAVIAARILTWQAETGSLANMRFEFEIELFSTDSLEKLFSVRSHAAYREEPHSRVPRGPAKAIRRAVFAAMRQFPPLQ